MYKKNAWKKYNGESLEKLMQFNEEYIDFLSKCKTERLCVDFAVKEAEKKGFKNIESFKELKSGDKVYFVNRNKNINLFVIGKKSIEEGMRILGAHIDSPRIDVKQNPLYEDNGFALLDGHYYGGIKKYQWVTTPLALYGVVCLKNGKTINVSIGDIVYGEVPKVSASVTGVGGKVIGTASVKVYDKSGVDVTRKLSKLSVGTYTVVAPYAGNENYTANNASKMFTVNKVKATLTLSR